MLKPFGIKFEVYSIILSCRRVHKLDGGSSYILIVYPTHFVIHVNAEISWVSCYSCHAPFVLRSYRITPSLCQLIRPHPHLHLKITTATSPPPPSPHPHFPPPPTPITSYNTDSASSTPPSPPHTASTPHSSPSTPPYYTPAPSPAPPATCYVPLAL